MLIVPFRRFATKKGGDLEEKHNILFSKILCFSSKPPLRTAKGGEHTCIPKKVG